MSLIGFNRSSAALQISMPRWLCVFAAMTLSVGACGASVATRTLSPNPSAIQNATVTINGQVRSYTVYRPPSLDAKQLVPLVVAIHGYTVDSTEMETSSHFDDQAKQSGFIVVYPQGLNNSWNAGSCCGHNSSDDVGFIRVLIDRLISGGQVDPKRVFVTGMSNGGAMAHRLACELSDRIAAVASVSGALLTDACNPARPISVLEMHGTADSVVPFEGGFTANLGHFPSTISFMTRWATLDGCASSPTVTQSGITQISTWSGCREGTRVVLEAVTGADHSWFGPEDALPGEPNATEVVWDFFNHQPARA
jgi:polyhydroxybutyrate depolymerase